MGEFGEHFHRLFRLRTKFQNEIVHFLAPHA
jgi:hypothetical protein